MATAIQLLRSAVPHLRPDPGVLADGMPMVNLAEESPGLYFRLANGTLSKIGPAHIGTDAPNASPQGHSGNTIGEIWVDTTNPSKISLKVWEGTQWIEASSDPALVSPTPPTSPEGGDLWYDNSSNLLQYWNGSEWVAITDTPAAGTNQEVQFNNLGEFGSDSSFTFSSFEQRLTVPKATHDEASITDLSASNVVALDIKSTTATLTGALVGQGATFSQDVTINADLTANSLTSVTYVNADTAAITNQITAKDGTFSGDVKATNFLINTLPSLP